MIKKLFFYKKLEIEQIATIATFIIAALTGLVSTPLLTICFIICCCVLLFCNKLYLIFPFVLFYNTIFGTSLGLSIMRIFSLFVCLNVLLRIKEKNTIKPRIGILFLIYILYILFVMVPSLEILSAVFLLLDIFSCFIVVSDVAKKQNLLREFFSVYSIICFISFFSGIIANNFIYNEYTLTRFNGTFEDPNYMGFFFTIAIFSIVCLKLFNKYLRVLFIISLYVMIFTSLSLTAIVVNLIVWLFYFIFNKNLKSKNIVLIFLSVFLVFILYNVGLYNKDIPIIGSLVERINGVIDNVALGNYGEATTGRTDLAFKHLDYFFNSSIVNIFFGGIPSNSRLIHSELGAAAHNEYVDMLLNVGVVGTLVLIFFFFSTMFQCYKKYKLSKDKTYLFILMGKVIWAVYALTLTMFLDYRFMFMFII